MLEVIKSPWQSLFTYFIKEATKSVYLASPFIKTSTASLIAQNVNPRVDFRYINSFKLAHFHNGGSDLEALRILKNVKCKEKNVHKLHAKFFIFDDVAIVTSGNLTPGGLRNNLEYGILVRDKLVDSIKTDYLEIFDDPQYPEITVAVINKAEEILAAVPREKKKALKIKHYLKKY
ncbi:MAG TPA: phospholipase D-like domain-containing protein [Dehalococcoidales bacterium]|nr:phospholipase D-like domain-containing protein [Dehalococcoidales bacterium]